MLACQNKDKISLRVAASGTELQKHSSQFAILFEREKFKSSSLQVCYKVVLLHLTEYKGVIYNSSLLCSLVCNFIKINTLFACSFPEEMLLSKEHNQLEKKRHTKVRFFKN